LSFACHSSGTSLMRTGYAGAMASTDPRDKNGRLKRKPVEMTPDIKQALETTGLRADFDHRPPYQRNEYLAWVTRAEHPDIRAKRLKQMLDELGKGGLYKRADDPASRK
jgi:hypothetical protein